MGKYILQKMNSHGIKHETLSERAELIKHLMSAFREGYYAVIENDFIGQDIDRIMSIIANKEDKNQVVKIILVPFVAGG